MGKYAACIRGRNKPPKRGGGDGGGGNGGSATSFFGLLGKLAIGGAVLAAAVALVYSWSATKAVETVVRKADAVRRDLGVGELTEREAVQQGRRPKSWAANRCVDAGAFCNGITEDKCHTDENMRSKCCRNCHMLTCVDREEQCEFWAEQYQCLDNAEYMKENCAPPRPRGSPRLSSPASLLRLTSVLFSACRQAASPARPTRTTRVAATCPSGPT